MFLLIASRKLWIYQVLPFIINLRHFTNRSKISDQEFCWTGDCKFIQDWESEIEIQHGLQTNVLEN